MVTSIKPETITWADDQVTKFQNRHSIYITYADILERVLSHIAHKYAPYSLVQARAKEVPSFAGKIWRKIDESNDPVNQFTDLCGGRIITNNQDEVKAVCSYIESHFDIDWENSVDISQRLKPSEFGYRSVHYIIRFKKGVFPNDDVRITIPDELYPDPKNSYQLKAEIQVRTILEHSWADFSHRISYKRPFKIPPIWEREMAKMAAFLEEADSQLIRIQKGLRHYLECFGAYMTPEQMEQEIEILENVLRKDSNNAVLADEIARLAISLGDWNKAIQVLSPFQNGEYLPAVREYANALCNKYDEHKNDQKMTKGKRAYQTGQELLQGVIAKNPLDIAALCALGGTYRDIDEACAKAYYQQAFELEPDNPYPLNYYLDYAVMESQDLSFAQAMKAIIRRAYTKSRELADAGLEIPWSYFNMGKFSLLLGDPYDAIRMYVKGCRSSSSPWPILLALRSLEKFKGISLTIPGYESIIRFIKLYIRVNYLEEAEKIGFSEPSRLIKPIVSPIVIVCGGTDVTVEEEVQKFKALFVAGVQNFKGTIISGGTLAGVCRIVGDLQEQYGTQFRSIGYLPQNIPSHIEKDKRYTEFRYSEGEHFSPLEAILYWEDILRSGINPADVRLIGVNGGKISGAEIRIALAFGARVGVVSDSGNEASKILLDSDWKDAPNLISLPNDPLTFQAFFGSDGEKIDGSLREKVGQLIHHQYQEETLKKVKDDPTKSNLLDWELLPENLRESNRDQADHIIRKLHAVGYGIREVTGGKPKIISFTEEEVEYLSEMEHGRWNAERLLSGWRYGKEKDIVKKISPYLVPWDQLSEEIKDYDRNPVRNIPKNLVSIGIEMVKKKETEI